MRTFYRGIRMEIPKHVKYVAMDSNGEIYGYRYKPKFEDGIWECKDKDNPMKLYTTPFTHGAENSLVKI